MKIQEKPDYLIFADSAKNGECVKFPDVSRGWGVTIDQTASKPPLEWMNGAFNRIDKNMLYLLQQGVPEWCEYVKYPVNAIIKYNGVLYTAIVENDNAIPTTSNKWKKTISEVPTASTTQKGVVKLSSATNSVSETEAATPTAVKIAYDLASSAQNNANTAKNIANAAVKRTGDNMSGALYINGEPVLTKRSYGIGVSHVLNDESIDETKNKYSGFLFSQPQSNGVKPFNYSHVMRSAINDSFADFAVDILSKRAKFRGVLTDEKNAAYSGDYSWTEFITTQNMSNYLPVGIPQPWPTNQPPAGWLECNGSTFDKNKFPKLAVVYPTGKLPDLRGVFIRGLDTGSGLDPNRSILSYQNDAIRNIVGSTGYLIFGGASVVSGAFREERLEGNGNGVGGGYYARNLFFDASRVVPTANENRPRNIAFMYIVKAE